MNKIWELQLSNTIVFWGIEYQLILQTYKLYVYHSQFWVPVFLVCFFRSLFIPYYWVPSVSNCFTTRVNIKSNIITLNIEKFTSIYNSKNVSCFTCAWMNCIYFISWWKQLNHFWINWFFCLKLKTLMQNFYILFNYLRFLF